MRAVVQLTCLFCQKSFEREKKYYDQGMKRGHKNSFCSRSCSFAHKTKESTVVVDCANCGHPCRKLKCRSPKHKNFFCNRSCAAIHNNKHYKKRVQQRCYQNRIDVTSDAASKIRQWGWSKCLRCNYDWAIDACHIKPVKDFKKGTPLTEVNAKHNLVGLCKNCHWRFDHDKDPTFRDKILVKKQVLDAEDDLNSLGGGTRTHEISCSQGRRDSRFPTPRNN